MAERICLDVDDDLTLLSLDREHLNAACRGGAVSPLAERDKIVEADQACCASTHGVGIQPSAVIQYEPATQWGHTADCVADPVLVTAPQRAETGVEGSWHLPGRIHPHVARQHPGKASQRRISHLSPDCGGEVHVRDLSDGVHPGVSASGDRQLNRRQAQHRGQRLLNNALYGALAGLDGPPGEVGAVVGKIKPDPHGVKRVE